MRVKSIKEVLESRLCLGCGVCAYLGRESGVRMIEVPSTGYRPLISEPDKLGPGTDCFEACPAVATDGVPQVAEEGIGCDGRIIEVWEGYASDGVLRQAGASGGALSALAAYCIEKAGMEGVLHIGQDPDDPLRNKTRLSRSRKELLSHTGSRYAPASACDSLHLIEEAESPCVFIGQPSEIAAVTKARKLRPALDEKLGVLLSFFCAGSPAGQGTRDLLAKHGVDASKLETLRYRGDGWPGKFVAYLQGETDPAVELTYQESWSFLQAYRPWSTQLWPDGSGEDADISCGDPWYRKVEEGELGSSLVLVRTERGREIVRGAMAAGYLDLKPAEMWKVERSQENLRNKKGAVWGRLMMLRLMGLPVPRRRNYGMFRLWLRLSFKDKLRSTFGTLRRVLSRGYFRPDRSGAPDCGAE